MKKKCFEKKCFQKKCSKMMLGAIYLLTITLGWTSSVSSETLKSYDFEDSTVMGWAATTESGKAERISNVSTAALGTENVLQVDVVLEDSGWSDTYLLASLDNGNAVDVSTISSIDYTVYVPTTFSGTMKFDCAVNNSWKGSDSWPDLDTSSTETLGGVSYIKNTIQCALSGASTATEVVLRVAASNSPYTGAIYFDNVVVATSAPDDSTPTIEPRDPVVYDLEDSNHGWVVGWADSMSGESLAHSNDLTEANNTGSIKLDIPFSGAGWEGLNLKKLITASESEKFDLNGYDRVEFDAYVPASSLPTSGGLKLVAAFDGNWLGLGDHHFYNLDGTAGELVTLNGTDYYRFHDVTEIPDDVNKTDSAYLVLRVHGYQIPGPLTVYLDNIQILPPDPGTIVPVSPTPNTVVGETSLEVQVLIPYNTSQSISNAQVSSTLTDTPVALTGSGLLFSGTIEGITNDDLGLHMLTVTATLNQEDNSTVDMKTEIPIYVDLSQTTIASQLTSHIVSGETELLFAITSADATIEKATYRINSQQAAATTLANQGSGSFTATLDTTKLKEGVHTLIVEAMDSNAYTHRSFIDIVVVNRPISHFVKRDGIHFSINGNKFGYAGWNAYNLPFLDNGFGFSSGDIAVVNLPGEEVGFQVIPAGTTWSVNETIDRAMVEARRLGMTVLRTWAFNSRESEASTIGYGRVVMDENATENFVEHNGNKYVWSYNEAQFERLDYLMDSARRHGIRVILTLENYWGDYGGIQTLTDALGLEDKLEFFTDEAAHDLFELYASHLIQRVNTVNGETYKNDPALFAWELMNEPRMDCRDNAADDDDEACRTEGPTQLGDWFDKMADYVKSIDSNHMVATGAEAHGFTEDTYGTWPSGDNGPSDTEGYGLDPIGVMDQSNIDFFTYHPYFNEEWSFYGFDQTAAINEAIVKDAHEHGKPIVMEEWGFASNLHLKDINDHEVDPSDENFKTLREEWYRFMLQNWREAGGNGHNIWMLQINGQDSKFGILLYTSLSRSLKDMTLANILRSESVHYGAGASGQGSKTDLTQLKSAIDGAGNGWSLMGTSIPISDFSIFDDVKSVWAWKNTQWSVYATNPTLQVALQQDGFPVLTQIGSHGGFWIKK